jgi:hypothetical protein
MISKLLDIKNNNSNNFPKFQKEHREKIVIILISVRNNINFNYIVL